METTANERLVRASIRSLRYLRSVGRDDPLNRLACMQMLGRTHPRPAPERIPNEIVI